MTSIYCCITDLNILHINGYSGSVSRSPTLSDKLFFKAINIYDMNMDIYIHTYTGKLNDRDARYPENCYQAGFFFPREGEREPIIPSIYTHNILHTLSLYHVDFKSNPKRIC